MSEFIDQTFDGKGKTIEFPKGEYDSCHFIDCIFTGENISHFIFVECTFNQCDLSTIKVENTSFKDVKFVHCKMLGIQFEHANPFLFQIEISECQLNLSSFYQVNLKSTIFNSCSLKEVDFTESNLSEVKLTNCDLSNAIFNQTNLQKTDFYSSYNFQIDPTNNNLKGAKFSKEGALGLLTGFSIKIN